MFRSRPSSVCPIPIFLGISDQVCVCMILLDAPWRIVTFHSLLKPFPDLTENTLRYNCTMICLLCNDAGCKEMIDLYEILLKAPGVFGARFSGAGFRGCCLALVDADLTDKAAAFVKQEYQKVQPELASKLPQDRLVLICEPGDSAHVI